MKKLLSLILVLGLLIFLAWYFWPGQKPATTVSNGGTFPDPSAGVSQGGTGSVEVFTLQTGDGSILHAKDPTVDPLTYQDPFTPDHYYLGNHIQIGTTTDPTAGKELPYIIEYIKSTNFFNVALLKEPLGDSRREAEQYLLTHLRISQSDACNLKYSVAVPHWVNEQFAGADLRFSFCPGATVLP